MKRILCCLLLAISFFVAAPAGAGNILFVTDTDTDLGIADVLTNDGHTVTVVTNDYASNNATLQGDLSAYCAIFWSTSQTIHDEAHGIQATITNLSNYVSGGGHVFVTGADGVRASYNPTTFFLDFLGAESSDDQGYNFDPVINESNSMTTGVVDIRGAILPEGDPDISDTDSLCGPLLSGTIGIVTNSDSCNQAGGYSWTLRTLGDGEIAYVMSGNFSSTNPPDEPDWTDTSMSGFGAYNGVVRNFAYNACLEEPPAIPSMNQWGMIIFALLMAGAGTVYLKRQRKAQS